MSATLSVQRAAPASSVPVQALRLCLPHFVAAALFSGAMNLLYLATPLYLLQVYNRVLPSRSGPP